MTSLPVFASVLAPLTFVLLVDVFVVLDLLELEDFFDELEDFELLDFEL